MTAHPPPGRSGPGSRALIVMLLVGAVIVALLPVIIARTRRVHTMREERERNRAESPYGDRAGA